MNEPMMEVIVDVRAEVSPERSGRGNGPIVRCTLTGTDQPGIVLWDVFRITQQAEWRIKQALIAIGKAYNASYTADEFANALDGQRVRVEVKVEEWNRMRRFAIHRWKPIAPDPKAPTLQRRYRGQCDFGHVFTGELFGPTTPDELEMTCPLDVMLGCGQMNWHAYDEEDDHAGE